MAEAILQAGPRSVRTKIYPNPRFPLEPDPDTLPDVYASVACGRCLEPVFPDGACLVFSRTEHPEAGDFVGIWRHPDDVKPGEFPRLVKRLVFGLPKSLTLPFVMMPGSAVEPIIVAEMLNPPRAFTIPASRVVAIHKVVGVAEDGPPGLAKWDRSRGVPQ